MPETRYAEIETPANESAEDVTGVVTNIVVCEDPDHAAGQGWYLIPEGMDPEPGIGWIYDNGEWSPPPEPPVEPSGSDIDWTNVTPLANGWKAGAVRPAQILLDQTVHLRGVIGQGTAGRPAFTLPPGRWPSAAMTRLVPDGTTASDYVTVGTDGTVTPVYAATALDLSAISFPVV